MTGVNRACRRTIKSDCFYPGASPSRWPLLTPRVWRASWESRSTPWIGVCEDWRDRVIGLDKFGHLTDRLLRNYSPAWHRVCRRQTRDPLLLARERALPAALGGGQWARGLYMTVYNCILAVPPVLWQGETWNTSAGSSQMGGSTTNRTN